MGMAVTLVAALVLTSAGVAVLKYPDEYLRLLRWTSGPWTSLLPERLQRLRDQPAAQGMQVFGAAVPVLLMAAAAWIGLLAQIIRATAG